MSANHEHTRCKPSALPTDHGRLARRNWLTSVTAAGVAWSLASLPPFDSLAQERTSSEPDAAQDFSVPKYSQIDAHSHIWTRDVEKFPLAPGTTVDDLAPASFTTEELLDVAEAHQIGRVVLIAHHLYYGYDNRYMIDAAKRYPGRFRVVGMVDDQSANPGRQMRELARQHVSGFRITSGIRKQQWLEGPGMAEMWETAADTGQAICCLVNPEDLPGVDQMCRRHGDTPVVIDHFARIGIDGEIREEDLARLCALSRHPRVHVKISAYYALGKKEPPYLDLVPMIRRVLDAFGPERAMWASDSPYQLDGVHSYTASVNLIREKIDFLTDSDRMWLLEKTAEKVYFSDLNA